MAATHRINDPVGTRRKIVETAFECFSRNGYGETTTLDIKHVAGVTGGAFSHHFQTKKELCLAVIRGPLRAAIEITWINPVVGAPDTLVGIEDAFRAIIADLGSTISGCPLNNLVLELSAQDDDLRSEMAMIFDEWRQAIARKFSLDFARIGILDAQPDHLASLVIATYSGAMTMAKASQNPEPLRDCLQQLSSFLKLIYRPQG
ncbi:TetR/AcrR family transcriptional regulator [Rhizobium multihospitium]|uniref:Transcriptional regulator, TetR family n=1 Tax=Rhizobium multihospitium TaxID=410764 RepID=A0A1C3U4Z7_9HYPH|nr:TetR/AcrR family transcriptional regulator [Rhizobium multihospitium]SCB10415.1 transcriptional regulator, TetR family [Rhizobium multihospitium]